MKVSVDVEITPEEMRRLLGLPDFSPAQDLIVDKVTRQIEKGLEGQLLSGVMKTVISGGVQGLEAYQKLVSGILSGSKSGRDGSDTPHTKSGSKPTGQNSEEPED